MRIVFEAKRIAVGLALTGLPLMLIPLYGQTNGTSPTVTAQAPPSPVPPKRNVDAEVSQMTKRYELSLIQVDQVRGILKDETKKTEAMLSDDSLSPVERLTKLKSLRDEEISRVSGTLNPEQLDKYKKDVQPTALPQFQPPANFPPPPEGL